MQRRKFVIGMGALASGTAAAVGTGAFSMETADREMAVDVVSDDRGLIEYDVSGAPDPLVDIGDDGRFRVDFGAAEGDGVNVDSEIVVGRDFDSPRNGDNITIRNASSRDFGNVKYTFEAGEDFHASSDDTYFGVSVATGQDSGQMVTDADTSSGDTTEMVVDGFGAGEDQQMNLKVSTIGADLEEDDLSGTLSISVDYDDY